MGRKTMIFSICRAARAHYQWGEGSAPHGLSRHRQHRHSARCPFGSGRHHVEPGGDAFRGAAAAGVPAARDARGRIGARRVQVRRRARDLRGRLDRAGSHPVRRRLAHAVCDLPQRAGAGGHARDGRCAAHGGIDRAGREIPARDELDRGAAGRRGRRLDRRRRGVLPGSCPRSASAPARGCHARGRIRQQRSVRGSAHDPSGRVSFARRSVVAACAHRARRAGRARHRHRHARRPRHRLRAQSAGAGAGPACAVRGHQRARHFRPRLGAACLGLSRGLSGRTGGRQPPDARPQHGGGLSRRRDLARADRDVRAARPAGMAAASASQASDRRLPSPRP